MSRFDEEPDGNPHNICVAAINLLMNENETLRQQLAEVSKPAPIKENDMTISDFEQGYLPGRVVLIDEQAKQIEPLRKALNKIANLIRNFILTKVLTNGAKQAALNKRRK
jgi:hypothetical protein